jgi:hypothetical protein
MRSAAGTANNATRPRRTRRIYLPPLSSPISSGTFRVGAGDRNKEGRGV